MRFPSVRDVASSLSEIKKDMVASGEIDNEPDVRLQVHEDGGWDIHLGDPSYDTDHRGFWGAGGLTRTTVVRDLARELIAEARKQAAQVNG